MATSKLNAAQYAALASNFSGVVFVYNGANGEPTAQHFFGADYEAKDKSQDELFRVVKNIMVTYWTVKSEELKLRESNDGIRSKLRASTPSRILINTANGEKVKNYELDESVWARIGLVPTKKDLERTARDYKKATHAAAKALFDALGFRVELPKEEKEATNKVKEKPAQTTASAEKPLQKPTAAAA